MMLDKSGDDLCPLFLLALEVLERSTFWYPEKKSESMTIDVQHCLALLINGTYNILLRVTISSESSLGWRFEDRRFD